MGGEIAYCTMGGRDERRAVVGGAEPQSDGVSRLVYEILRMGYELRRHKMDLTKVTLGPGVF
jgi:hypothetical protein